MHHENQPASYLMWLPGLHGGQHLARLRAAGLEALTGDNSHTLQFRELLEGPDAGPGVLVNWFDASRRELEPPLRYERDAQEWSCAKPDAERGLPAGRYWLGRYADRPITPEALQRPRLYSSCQEKLLDGRLWKMPIARDLPQNLALDEEGRVALLVKPAMRDYFDRAQNFFDEYLAAAAGGGGAYTLAGAWSFAARGLALNYLLTPEVISWLGLLDEDSLVHLVGASFEWRKLLELGRALQKKTEQLAPHQEPPATPATS